MLEREPLRVGVIGVGNVGSMVVRALRSPRRLAEFEQRTAGRGLRLVGVSRRREPRDSQEIWDLTCKPEEVIRRSEVVVELVGGVREAFDFTLDALRQGKDIVNANKALMAAQLFNIMEAAERSGRTVRYNAAVGGGTDVLDRVDAMANVQDIHEINAIANGTSNLILSLMAAGKTYMEALRHARDLGVAEADPSLDVGGQDAAQKGALLSTRGLGLVPRWDTIPTTGITGLTARDMDEAARHGQVWKHVVKIRRINDTTIAARSEPTLVPAHSAFGRTFGVQNAFDLLGSKSRVTFFGPGAGGMATAETVLSDLVRTATGERSSPFEGQFKLATILKAES